MPKSYSPAFVEALSKVDMRDNLGIVMARACIKANLPASMVAKILGVSRMTIHTWFRGGPIRAGRVELVHAFLRIVQEDTAKGVLPLADFKSARAYLRDLAKIEPA